MFLFLNMQTKFLLRRSTLLFFSVVLVSTSFAQPVTELDPVNITSDRWPVRSSENGRQLTVLTASQIEALPGNTIEDVLRVSGLVELQQRGPMGAVNDVVIRGGTFQQVLILIDGIKLNDPVTGHFSANFPLPKWQIERIEILKGPAAAVYGTEAVGGVVHIISKAFASKDSLKNNGYAYLLAGANNTLGVEGGMARKIKQTSLMLGASSDNTAGHELRTNGNGYVHKHNASFAIKTPLNKNSSLHFMSVYDFRDFAAVNFYTTFTSDTASERVKTWWNHLKWSHQKNKSQTNISLSYKSTRDRYAYNPLSVINDNKSNAWLLQMVRTTSLQKNLHLTYGYLGELLSISSNDRGDHETIRNSIFTSVVWQYNNLSVLPGIRFVNDEGFGSEILPQLSVNYGIGNFILKGNAGRAIRSADFTERYNNYNKPIVNSGSIGNPDLGAERSWSYEAGLDFRKGNIVITTSYFVRNQKNVIDWVSTHYDDMPRKENLVAGNTYVLARNVRTLDTKGVEFSLNWQKQINKSWWIYLNTTSTFIDSKSDAPTPSFYIRSHAKQLHQHALLIRYNSIALSLSGIYKVRDAMEANAIEAAISKHYYTLNTKLNYSHKKLNIFINVLNIGDVKYADLLGSYMPGRWITAGISKQFGN